MKIMNRRPISMDMGLLLLRLTLGFAMLTHGWPKFQKLMNLDFQFADPIGLGPEISLILTVLAEFLCSILIILGVATRWSTVPLIITMAVAFFIVHGPDDFRDKEMAFLFLGGYLTLFFTGPGKFSMDR